MGIVVPVGDAQAAFVFGNSAITKEMTWTLGFRDIDSFGAAQAAEDIYNSFAEAIPGPDLPYHENSIISGWRFYGVDLTIQQPSGPLTYQYRDQVNGNTAIQSLPVNCSLLLTKNTALGGRKNRGRAYVPICRPGETEVDVGGFLESTILADIENWYAAAFGNLLGFGLEPCVHHSDGSAGTLMTGFSVGGRIATQRRRMR